MSAYILQPAVVCSAENACGMLNFAGCSAEKDVTFSWRFFHPNIYLEFSHTYFVSKARLEDSVTLQRSE
jgi:hypothetical protein